MKWSERLKSPEFYVLASSALGAFGLLFASLGAVLDFRWATVTGLVMFAPGAAAMALLLLGVIPLLLVKNFQDRCRMKAFEASLNELHEIKRLLTKHGFPGQADVVDRLIGLAGSNLVEFRKSVLSIDMWGGSGAVWEVGPFSQECADEAEAKQDERSFRQAIIRLASALDRMGMGNEHTRFIASTFMQWNRAGL